MQKSRVINKEHLFLCILKLATFCDDLHGPKYTKKYETQLIDIMSDDHTRNKNKSLNKNKMKTQKSTSLACKKKGNNPQWKFGIYQKLMMLLLKKKPPLLKMRNRIHQVGGGGSEMTEQIYVQNDDIADPSVPKLLQTYDKALEESVGKFLDLIMNKNEDVR